MENIGEILSEEKALYLGNREKGLRRGYSKRYCIWKYLYYFRLERYYNEKRINEKSRINRRIAKIYNRKYERLKNKWGAVSGVEIGKASEIGKNTDIWHGGVVINGKVGEGCIFHGNNILGNKGKSKKSGTPTLGKRVDVGAGAVIIGDVKIADECIIGAGAVVVSDFPEAGSVIAGVPAKRIK